MLVKQFLQPHLPSSLAIRSGVIVDADDLRSRQQDLIIIDKDFPLISIGSDDAALIVAESVLATIEVKSNLTGEELTKTLDSINLTKNLTRSGELQYKKSGAHIRTPMLPINAYVFAYEGISTEAIGRILSGYADANPKCHFPDAICVLGQSVSQRSQFMPVVKGGKNSTATMPPVGYVQVKHQELVKDALYVFYTRFLDDIQPLRVVNYHLDGYYNEDDVE